MEKEAETTVMVEGRKRTAGKDESETSTFSFQAKTPRLGAEYPASSVASSESSACESGDPYHVLSSGCSSNGTRALAEVSSDFVDLEENKDVMVQLFLSTSALDAVGFGERRENVPSSEVVSKCCKLARLCESKSTPPEIKIATADELEEFFAAAEKQLQVQFIDQYNYDIVNDKPLEGRFEWVQISP